MTTSVTGNASTFRQNPSANGGSAIRHLEGANYAFADGHVKWYKPTKISGGNISPTGDNVTFGIK